MNLVEDRLAKHVHDERVGVVNEVKDGVGGDAAVVDEIPELPTELMRKKRQKLDPFLGDELTSCLRRVLRVAQDAEYKSVGHGMLAQVPAEQPHLLRLIGAHLPKLRDRCRQAAHETGEEDQAKDDDRYCKSSFKRVYWLDLHRARCKLRQRPMHGGQVPVGPFGLPKCTCFDPVRAHPEIGTEDVPNGRDVMVQKDQDPDKLGNVHEDEHVLRINTVRNEDHESLQLCQTKQAHHPNGAQSTEQLRVVLGGVIPARPQLRDLQEPIWCGNRNVNHEPSLDVVQQDLRVIQNQDTVFDVASDEGHEDVACPIQQRKPRHRFGEKVLLGLEGREGDCNGVIRKKQHTIYVPADAERAGRLEYKLQPSRRASRRVILLGAICRTSQ
mmetsp:Transcript_13846/g.37600  ORF Transcript_13846/g.37600 Transcript_13846/m.37600 type:complete len:384 (+) Transcript_13846:545-1696(+)